MPAKIPLLIDIKPIRSRLWRTIQIGLWLASAAVITSLPSPWYVQLILIFALISIVRMVMRQPYWQRLRFDGICWQLLNDLAPSAQPRLMHLRGDTVINSLFVLLRFDEPGLARTQNCLVWRDSLSADGYRHLLVAVRQLAPMVTRKVE